MQLKFLGAAYIAKSTPVNPTTTIAGRFLGANYTAGRSLGSKRGTTGNLKYRGIAY